jgi:hypothetical protein
LKEPSNSNLTIDLSLNISIKNLKYNNEFTTALKAVK